MRRGWEVEDLGGRFCHFILLEMMILFEMRKLLCPVSQAEVVFGQWVRGCSRLMHVQVGWLRLS
jgi:hypothetical protein